MKKYPQTYTSVFRAVWDRLLWIMHESEHRVNNTLNRWSLAHWWSLCGVNYKGFDRKWMATWSGNQKSCCSRGHFHCGFYLKLLLLQQGSSPDVSKAASHGHQVSLMHFFGDVFPQKFFENCYLLYCLVNITCFILRFLYTSVIWYSINFISISQEKLLMWLRVKVV